MIIDAGAPSNAIKFIKLILKFIKFGRMVENLKGRILISQRTFFNLQ